MYHVHVNNKEVIYYAKPSLGERCFVHLMELYLSKLPAAATEKDFFYCKPAKILVVGKAWYHNCPLGHNALRSKLKDMFVLAELDHANVGNHSLRATSVSRLFEDGVSEKLIMERSGHLSTSGVRSYERTTPLQKQMVSNLLTESSGQSIFKKPLSSLENQIGVLSSDVTNEKVEDCDGKENEIGNLLKHINFEKMDGCTINFNFSGVQP